MNEYQELKKKVADEIVRSNPSCGIMKECITNCGECGFDRIIGMKVGNLRIGVVDEGAELPMITLEAAAEHDSSEPWCAGNFTDSLQVFAQNAQQEMLKAGWVKVITQESEGE